MKSIMELGAVKDALATVVAESDVNNGTRGIEFFCHYWSHENQFDRERQDLINEMAKSVLLGKPDEVAVIRSKIEQLGTPKIIMEFKLMAPIPVIRGTKTVTDGNKLLTIQADNVKTIFIPQDSLVGDLVEFEETDDKAKDRAGNEAVIIKLKIKKGLLDVAGEIVDSRQRILREKRVYLTAVSYHALQTVGKMKYNEEQSKRRRYGFNEMMMNQPL